MPKVKVFPTPAQAKILQALHDYEGLHIVYFPHDTGRSYAEWGCDGGWRAEAQATKKYGKPRASTIRKMFREGWLGHKSEDQRFELWLTDIGEEVRAQLTPEHFYSQTKGMATWQVIDALKRRHQQPEWIFVEELRLGTGYGRMNIPGHSKAVTHEQRIDAFVLNCYPSRKNERWAYEIKVSRGDFIHELKQPDKRVGAMHISNRFYFAAPEGLIKTEELPDMCGLMEVRGDTTRIVVKAPWRESCDPYWPLVAAIGRSLLK